MALKKGEQHYAFLDHVNKVGSLVEAAPFNIEKAETKNVEICGLDIPIYEASCDYQYLYHKLFQDNESML